MLHRRNRLGLRAALVAAVIGCGAAACPAGVIVNFIPAPSSPAQPELVFGGAIPSLSEGSGSVGNGDGVLPPSLQNPGGLNIETRFTIPGIAGSSINSILGSTTFYDVSLDLSGFAASGMALPAAGMINQPLGSGTFSLTGTDGTLLLAGSADMSLINGTVSGQSAGVLSATLTYTGGVIFSALMDAGGQPQGSFSWSLLDISPALGWDGNGYLTAFTANATGLFSARVVPEPASALLLGVAAIGLLGRRGRRS